MSDSKPTDYIFYFTSEFVLIYYASKTNDINMLVLRYIFLMCKNELTKTPQSEYILRDN